MSGEERLLADIATYLNSEWGEILIHEPRTLDDALYFIAPVLGLCNTDLRECVVTAAVAPAHTLTLVAGWRHWKPWLDDAQQSQVAEFCARGLLNKSTFISRSVHKLYPGLAQQFTVLMAMYQGPQTPVAGLAWCDKHNDNAKNRIVAQMRRRVAQIQAALSEALTDIVGTAKEDWWWWLDDTGARINIMQIGEDIGYISLYTPEETTFWLYDEHDIQTTAQAVCERVAPLQIDKGFLVSGMRDGMSDTG